MEQERTIISSRAVGQWRDLMSASWFTVVTIGNVMFGRWDRSVSPGRFVLGIFRRRIGGTFDAIRAQGGHCYTACVPEGLVCDAEAGSRLVLLEDGTPIGPAHASHHDIREHGGGRYSHWGGHVYFSTPDGTDPRENGRVYSFRS